MNEQYLAIAFLLVPLFVQGVKYLIDLIGFDPADEWVKAFVYALVFGVSYGAAGVVAILSNVPIGSELVMSAAIEVFVAAIAVYDGVKIGLRLAKRLFGPA